jgi:tetratricopeptide (TPR) repeat protein
VLSFFVNIRLPAQELSMSRFARSLVARSLAATAFSLAAYGFASAPALAQKGEPSAPNKCDKLKKGSDAWKKCTGSSLREEMTDQEIYYSGYWLARTGQYAEALDFLRRAKVQDARILTYIGFATRKLGDHDGALGFYARALALDANYTVARAYLGEAYLTKGDLAAAREQLGEIATRCGTTCVEHAELAGEIAKYVAKANG